MAIDKNTISKEAQKFAAKGQFDKAIAEWKKLLKESPNDPNIFNTIGDLCLKKESKADAVDAYRRAADLLAADGFTSKAIALYKKVLNIDPKKIEVHLSLGDLNAEKGLTGNALESYKVVADHYTHEKEPAKALGIYQKMADLNPANVAFRVKLGDMYAKENMTSEASKAYLAAAEVHMSKNAFKDARQLFEKVLTLDPDNKVVYHKAGMVYFQEGKFSEACKALKPAFENDPANEEIADTYLEALSKAGKDSEAEQVIGKILAKNAKRTDLREKLVKIHLGKKDHHKALAEIALIAEAKAAEEGDRSAAENVLKAFVDEVPEYVPARQKLAEFYRAAGRNQDAAVTFLQAAEILTETDDQGGAKAFLNRALELAPDLQEAKERLEQVEAALSAALSPEPESAEEPVAVAQEKPAAKPPAAELPILEENPAINEAFTEVDVLLKYGLAAKALEQLEALAVKYPESPPVRMRLQDLYREQGNLSKAADHALALADLYASKNMKEQADSVLQSALSLDPNNKAVRAKLGMAPLPSEALPEQTVPAEPFLPGVSLPEVSLDEISPEPAVAPPAFEASPFSDEPAQTDEITFEGLDAGMAPLEEKNPFAETASPAAEPAIKKKPLSAEKSKAGAAKSPEKSVERIPEPEVPVHKPTVPIQPDVNEIWAEAEFYFQQGLFDEAKKHYAKIVELNPSNRRAIDRLGEISREEEKTLEFTKLADAVEELEGAAPETAEQELPFSSSDEDAVRSLMQEISQLGKGQNPAPPLPPAEETPAFSQPAPAPHKTELPAYIPEAAFPAGAKPAEEDFFDLGEELKKENSSAADRKVEHSPDDFFDLAAELRDELNTVAAPARPAGPAEEQSLDEIFEEFKQGVEQQSVKEDVDTHYNLGVAYKEMGLLDDAIAEFLLTPEDEARFIQSRYLLGLCYMEKGEYQNAMREIQHALHCSESLLQEDQDTLGMHYDLGLAYQGAGNISNAISEFQIVEALEPGYRDTVSKLKELQQGDFVSLDQLKDDIEKEISSKFFEEGERIEREEKNRKSERVRN